LKIGYHLDFQICKRFCKFAPVILLEQKALESSQRVTFSFSVDQLNSKLWQFTVGCWKNSFCAMDGAEIAAKNSLYLRMIVKSVIVSHFLGTSFLKVLLNSK